MTKMENTILKDTNKSIKLTMIICWVGLAICLFIKLFGGNIFDIKVESSRFIEVCNYIDSNLVLLTLIQLFNYLIVCYIYLCASLRKIKLSGKELLIVLTCGLVLSAIKRFVPLIGSILEILVFILLPILLSKCKWYMPVIYQILYNIFGFTSAFIKSIGSLKLPDNTLTGIIFMLDMYFMLTLFMVYNYKKEGIENG